MRELFKRKLLVIALGFGKICRNTKKVNAEYCLGKIKNYQLSQKCVCVCVFFYLLILGTQG